MRGFPLLQDCLSANRSKAEEWRVLETSLPGSLVVRPGTLLSTAPGCSPLYSGQWKDPKKSPAWPGTAQVLAAPITATMLVSPQQGSLPLQPLLSEEVVPPFLHIWGTSGKENNLMPTMPMKMRRCVPHF